MNITRRKFIAAAPVIAGVVLGAGNNVMSQNGVRTTELPPVPLDPASILSWDSFVAYQGTDFVLSTDDGQQIRAVLKETDNASSPAVNGQAAGECFTLKFVGPAKPVLPQATYDVSHFALGNFKMFVTDGGRARRGNYYIAVFNRIAG